MYVFLLLFSFLLLSKKSTDIECNKLISLLMLPNMSLERGIGDSGVEDRVTIFYKTF